MKIGILGSGDVGRSLAGGFAAHGHGVMVGTRHPEKPELAAWKADGGKGCSVGSFADAAAFGDVLVLCTLGEAAENVIELAGRTHFAGKIVIDVMNPLDFSHGMPPGLFVGTTDSLAERIQRKLPEAKVVKTLNIVNHRTMVDPRIGTGTPDMLLCGDDPAAKRAVSGLLEELGWEEPIDIGDIASARWMEALVPLWVRLAQKLGTWDVAFRVMRP